jgi:S-formylglutathione hydrolase FrmB
MLAALLSVVASTSISAARVDTIRVATTYVPSPEMATVVVPDSYYTGDTCRYNVVYLLHGFGDDYTGYATKMPVDSLAECYQTILVCPDGKTSWYWNSPVDTTMQMENFIIKDLVTTIDRRFRTRACRDGRAIVGLSMGGHGAMWLALRHKDVFGSAASMSGGLDVAQPQFRNNWEMKRWLGSQESNLERWRNYSAISLIPTLNPGELNLMIVCGYDDFFLDVNNAFHEALVERGIEHRYELSPGDHSWPYWRRVLPSILDFFTSNFR